VVKSKEGCEIKMIGIKQWKFFAIFVTPIFLLLIIFRYYPLFSAIYHSFTKWNVTSATAFTGLQNYINLFTDKYFIVSIENIFIYVVITTVIITVMSLIGAELIFNLDSQRFKAFWKYLFIVPMIVPFTVAMLIWEFIYNPYLGILNGFLNAIGLSNFALPWLGSSQTALYAVSFVGFPFISSVQFLIILSGLQSLDLSIIDATKIDGATTVQRIFKVDIPMIIDKIILAIMLTVIGNVQAVSNFYILTYGGPGTSTLVPGLYMYEMAFSNNSLGYACTIGIVMALITFALIFIIRKIEDLIEARYA